MSYLCHQNLSLHCLLADDANLHIPHQNLKRLQLVVNNEITKVDY